MEPLRPLALYQSVKQQLEVFAADDDGSVRVVWKESRNLSWRRAPLTLTAVFGAGAPLGGAFFAPQEKLAVFVVGLPQGTSDPTQGLVYSLSKLGNARWDGPAQISPSGTPRFAVGTPIAAASYPPQGTLEVLAAGNDGAVWVLWMSAADPWRSHPIAGPAFTKPRQPLASAYYPDQETLEALIVDAHGAVHVLWKTPTVGWREVGITPQGLANDGTHVALVYYDGYGQLEGFLVDGQGRVVVLWKTASTGWQWVPLTDPGFAPAGAPIAAVHYATHDQLEVFVVGHDGALWILWKTANAAWNPPLRLSEAGIFAPGAAVSAAHFPPTDQLEVIVGDRQYLAREMTKYENRRWRPCALPIAPRSGIVVVPEAQTSRLMQLSGSAEFAAQGVLGVDLGANATHKGTHFVFFGDVPRGDRTWGPGQDADAVAYAKYMDESAIELKLITGGDGLFEPFRVSFAGGFRGSPPGRSFVTELGSAQTPTGAFSWGEYVYVFVLVFETPEQAWPSPTSYLVRSRDPFNGDPYEEIFRFSTGNFWQVAPWVVPDLPELPRHSGNGVVMLGQGSFERDVADAVYMAWMPLTADGPQFDQIWYHTKITAPRQRRHDWTRDPSKAVPLWTTTLGYSSISLAPIEGSGRWIALYSHAIDKPHFRERSPVVARIGTSLTTWSSTEIVVFDPCRDGAYGNFMHWPDLDQLHLGGIPKDDVPGWSYGAFMVAPLTRWHPESREVTIHYLLSPNRPYQVQLMRSRFKIDVP